MLVQDFLQHSAERLPDKEALVCGDRRMTYAEVDAHVNRLANAMIDNGVQRGDRVVIFLNNSIEAVLSIFATIKAGGVFVFVNPNAKPNNLAYILNNCSATALVAELHNFSLVSSILEDNHSLKFSILSDAHTTSVKIDAGTIYGHVRMLDFKDILWTYSDQSLPRVNIDLDLACLIYTSNGAGELQGVMSDHSNILFATSSIIEYLANVEDDIVINMLPFSSDCGLYQLLMVIKFGGTLVLEQPFAEPATILKRIEEEQVTGFSGVPSTFEKLLKIDLSTYDLSSLRYLTNTATAMQRSHISQIQEMLPSVPLYTVYGLNENERILYLPPDQIKEHSDSMGIPIPGTEAWIEDEIGNRVSPGETGELVVRGRHVMRGYWEDIETTSIRYRPGLYPGEWVCYTGESFRMDNDGYFYYVEGRSDGKSNQGGKVISKEIDNFLTEKDEALEDEGVTPNQFTSVDQLSTNIRRGTEGS